MNRSHPALTLGVLMVLGAGLVLGGASVFGRWHPRPEPTPCPHAASGAPAADVGDEDQEAGLARRPCPSFYPTASPSAAPSSSPSAGPSPTPAPGACPGGDPLVHIYHPQRLQVLNACQPVSGRVLAALHESDGDTHIWLAVDPPYAQLLNGQNVYHGQPALVLEISPLCPGQPPNGSAAAACPANPLRAPAVGQHITAVGSYNLDRDHGWNELHPLYSWSPA